MFFNILFVTAVLINSNSNSVISEVKTQTSGNNASVRTEITTNVNGEITNIVSEKEGTIKVVNENGKTTVEESNRNSISNTNSPTPSISSEISIPQIISDKNLEPDSNKIIEVFTHVFDWLKKFITGT